MSCHLVSARLLFPDVIGLVGCCVLGLTMSNSDAAEPFEVRVLSYNIHHGEGMDRKLDLGRIAAVITSVKPDVVALQEVDQTVKRTGLVDQPAELARLTNMNVIFGGNISLQGGHYGNAILSRWPINKHVNRLLPNRNGGEQRGVIQAYLQEPGTLTNFMILATHFDHRSDDTERIASAKAIHKIVGEHPQSPAILAGDLNDGPESTALQELKQYWTNSSHKPMPTIPVTRPTRQIDFVLFRPKRNWEVVETRVLDETVASDHRAVLSVLRFHSNLDE